jgi:hypothetical protein
MVPLWLCAAAGLRHTQTVANEGEAAMQSKWIVTTACVVALACGAARPAMAVDTMGIGAQKCSLFLAALGGPDEKLFMQWILGYVSGLAVERNRDMLKTATLASVKARAVELCRPDPNEYLDDVLDDF